MQGFRQHDKTLFWESKHEIVQIEPWGRDSVRVRSTFDATIHADLVSALLPPASHRGAYHDRRAGGYVGQWRAHRACFVHGADPLRAVRQRC